MDWTKPHSWLVFAVMLIVTAIVLNQIGQRVPTVKRVLATGGLSQ